MDCWGAISAIASFISYPNGHDCWISTAVGALDHPHFGNVTEIYNVIDARQAEAQNTVIEALRGLGYNEQADHYTHFSYEMVALTPRCAAELGYQLSDEDKSRPYIEVSGRKGFGVKADDLLDRLIASAKNEVDGRHPQLTEAERTDDCHPDRGRRAALFHAEVHQVIRDRIRLQRGAELRRRDGPVRPVRRGPRAPTSSVRAVSIPRNSAEARQTAFLRADLARHLTGEAGNESGNYGWPLPKLPTSLTNRLPPPSPPIWRSMPSNSPNSLMLSTTGIRS